MANSYFVVKYYLMKWPFFLIFFSLIGCGQTFNSQTGDKFSGNILVDDSSPDGARTNKAFAILDRSCTNCHTSYHANWRSLQTDAAWVANGLVVKGQADISPVITKLKNVGGNMPPSAPAISEADYQALLDWIDLMP